MDKDHPEVKKWVDLLLGHPELADFLKWKHAQGVMPGELGPEGEAEFAEFCAGADMAVEVLRKSDYVVRVAEIALDLESGGPAQASKAGFFMKLDRIYREPTGWCLSPEQYPEAEHYLTGRETARRLIATSPSKAKALEDFARSTGDLEYRDPFRMGFWQGLVDLIEGRDVIDLEGQSGRREDA